MCQSPSFAAETMKSNTNIVATYQIIVSWINMQLINQYFPMIVPSIAKVFCDTFIS